MGSSRAIAFLKISPEKIFERLKRSPRGIQDQNIQASILGGNLIEHGRDRFFLRDVSLDGRRARAELSQLLCRGSGLGF